MASRGFCAPLSHISLTKSVLGQIFCFSRLLRSASGNARPGFLAALAEILRTADQFRPETLPAIAHAAAANVVELPPACCRIDKETPVQLVSFGHSGHGITSFLFLASIYRHRLLLCFASAEHQVRSLPGSFTPALLRSSVWLRLRRVVSSPDVRCLVVKVRGLLKSPLKCWSTGSLKICAFSAKTWILLFFPSIPNLSEAFQ